MKLFFLRTRKKIPRNVLNFQITAVIYATQTNLMRLTLTKVKRVFNLTLPNVMHISINSLYLLTNNFIALGLNVKLLRYLTLGYVRFR